MMGRQEPLRFVWRGHLFQIVRDYQDQQDQQDFLGICDGRIMARAGSRAEVALTLIKGREVD